MSTSSKTKIVVRSGDMVEFKSLVHRDSWITRCKQNEMMGPDIPNRFKVLEALPNGSITMVNGASAYSYSYDNYDDESFDDYSEITRVLDSGEIVDISHPLFSKGEMPDRTVYRSYKFCSVFTPLEVQMFLQHTTPAYNSIQDIDVCSLYLNPILKITDKPANDDSFVPESFAKIIKEKKAKTPRGVKEQISIHINKTIGSDKGAQELVDYIRSKFKVS